MNKTEEYREQLKSLPEWEPFLLRESGLPGPRANLELARAVAEAGDAGRFRSWLRWDAEKAPSQAPEEFLAFCGVLGLGRLLAGGEPALLSELRQWANDPRWRIREAVAMALQYLGARGYGSPAEGDGGVEPGQSPGAESSSSGAL